MKYVVGYTVPHIQEVKFGIEAHSPQEALIRVEAMFGNGTLWDESDGCMLLHDGFSEDEGAGHALEFTLTEELGDNDYPRRHASVLAMEKDATARAVAEQLVEAYRRATDAGVPVSSSDIDAAYLLALECQL